MAEGLNFHVCRPREAIDTAWVNQLLESLWHNGLAFGSGDSWQQQLDAQGFLTTETSHYEKPLREIIPLIASEQGGLLTGVSLKPGEPRAPIEFQMTFAEHPHFMWLSLMIAPSYAQPQIMPQQLPVHSYMESYQAFLKASSLLCETVDPLFGFGYDADAITDVDALDAFLTGDGGDLPQGQLPPWGDWFSTPPLCYLGPAFLHDPLVVQAQQSGWGMERLATGGLFIVPPMPPFTELHEQGYHLLLQANTQAASQAPAGKNDARLLFEQALATFLRVHDQRGIRWAKRGLESS